MDESLPNRDSGDSDGVVPPVTCLVRLTPYEAFTYEQLHKFVSDYFPKWIIARETTSKGVFHYHVVVETDDDDPKHLFQTQIHIWWPVRPRGFGNKQWNFQFADDEHLGVTYALKYKDYTFGGYDAEYIKSREEESFTKSTRSSFQDDFQLLRNKFQEDESMTLKSFIVEFVQLKAKHGQMVNLSQAHQYGLSELVRRDPLQAEGLVAGFMTKLNIY